MPAFPLSPSRIGYFLSVSFIKRTPSILIDSSSPLLTSWYIQFR